MKSMNVILISLAIIAVTLKSSVEAYDRVGCEGCHDNCITRVLSVECQSAVDAAKVCSKNCELHDKKCNSGCWKNSDVQEICEVTDKEKECMVTCKALPVCEEAYNREGCEGCHDKCITSVHSVECQSSVDAAKVCSKKCDLHDKKCNSGCWVNSDVRELCDLTDQEKKCMATCKALPVCGATYDRLGCEKSYSKCTTSVLSGNCQKSVDAAKVCSKKCDLNDRKCNKGCWRNSYVHDTCDVTDEEKECMEFAKALPVCL